MPLPKTPNFGTLIIKDKEKAIRATEALRPGPTQTLVYLDGWRIKGKNSAAAAWCANTKHFSTHQLGKESKYGILKAEYNRG